MKKTPNVQAQQEVEVLEVVQEVVQLEEVVLQEEVKLQVQQVRFHKSTILRKGEVVERKKMS
jgi:hypothetical protein